MALAIRGSSLENQSGGLMTREATTHPSKVHASVVEGAWHASQDSQGAPDDSSRTDKAVGEARDETFLSFIGYVDRSFGEALPSGGAAVTAALEDVRGLLQSLSAGGSLDPEQQNQARRRICDWVAIPR
jgi:hypothetical protein